MAITLTLEAKVLGQKRLLFPDWSIDLPPIWEPSGNRRKLRDLISSIVADEVERFLKRQDERRLARVLTPGEIEKGLRQGRVDSGERDLKQKVDVDQAVATALQAYEDGLYCVFIDDVQQTGLDSEVFLKPDSKVVFLRLVALAGG